MRLDGGNFLVSYMIHRKPKHYLWGCIGAQTMTFFEYRFRVGRRTFPTCIVFERSFEKKADLPSHVDTCGCTRPPFKFNAAVLGIAFPRENQNTTGPPDSSLLLLLPPSLFEECRTSQFLRVLYDTLTHTLHFTCKVVIQRISSVDHTLNSEVKPCS